MGNNNYIRFDWAAKRLLRQKANFDVLEGFLSVLLNEKIKIIEVLESEGNQPARFDKFNRVDVKAKNSNGEIIIIEIQNTREIHYLERVLYGVAKTITEHISMGESYSNIVKVYSISILYFDLGEGSDYIYRGQNNFRGIHTGDLLKVKQKDKDAIIPKLPKEIFPEYYLIRVNEFDKVATSPLEEWIYFLKTGQIDDNTKDKGLIAAKKKLFYYNMDDKERRVYDDYVNSIMIQNDVLDTYRFEGRIEGLAEGRVVGIAIGKEEGRKEGREEGRKEGREEGREEGAKLEKIKMLKSLIELNVPINVISQTTGLNEDEINQIVKKELKK